MTTEPREPTETELAAKRAALDRVLAAAKAERTEMMSLYDCAIWLLYACTRSDAINTARELREDDEDESEWTILDEIGDMIDLAIDDSDSAVCHEKRIEEIGKQLDPEFDKPARELTDWLDTP
jgi:hypothetical protein